jgi:hypothetical protein
MEERNEFRTYGRGSPVHGSPQRRHYGGKAGGPRLSGRKRCGQPKIDRRRNIMGMRQEYQAVMEKQLNEWKAQTERFKAGAGQMEEQAKARYEKNLALLRTKQDEAWQSFHKLENANEVVWGLFKVNMDKAGNELKEAAERMTTSLKKH